MVNNERKKKRFILHSLHSVLIIFYVMCSWEKEKEKGGA